MTGNRSTSVDRRSVRRRRFVVSPLRRKIKDEWMTNALQGKRKWKKRKDTCWDKITQSPELFFWLGINLKAYTGPILRRRLGSEDSAESAIGDSFMFS